MTRARSGLRLALGGSLALWAGSACAQAWLPGGNAVGSALGEWTGQYTCGQGLTGLTLSITQATSRGARAIFHFYADPSNPNVPTGCFEMSGSYDAGSGRLRLKGGRWLVQPPNYLTVDFTGEIDRAGRSFEGRVTGAGCTTFRLMRSPSPQGAPPRCVPGAVASERALPGGG